MNQRTERIQSRRFTYAAPRPEELRAQPAGGPAEVAAIEERTRAEAERAAQYPSPLLGLDALALEGGLFLDGAHEVASLPPRFRSIGSTVAGGR
jgi:hypothetical protein